MSSMDRRTFLRRSALIATGVVAADQLHLLEMLAPKRLWAGWTAPAPAPRALDIMWSQGVQDDMIAAFKTSSEEWDVSDWISSAEVELLPLREMTVPSYLRWPVS